LNVVAGPVPYPGPGPLCQAQLNIYDAADNLIASQLVSPPGSVSFDYGRPGGREELRPEAILMPTSAATGACQGQATAEVYGDAAKSTSVITPGLGNGLTNLPAVQFGPVGVGFLQAVRLSVVAFPPSSCSGTLSFTDLNGNPIGGSTQVNLTAGRATFIDLARDAVVGALGEHGEVLAMFTSTPGVAPGACIPSVAVYDRLTGRTQVLIPPAPTQQPTQ
jgi:hypothetical protein